MSNEQIIPWQEAQALGVKFNQDMVVVLTYNSESMSTSVITWGNTADQSDYAATAGNDLKKQIGWPEKYCSAVSAKVQALVTANETKAEAMKKATALLLDKFGLFGGGTELNEVFDVLNKALGATDGEAVV